MTIKKNFGTTLFVGVMLLFGSAARADVVFSFDDGTLAAGNTNAAIASYMDGKLGCLNCVTINPSGGTVYVDKLYTGDGHVVGPGTGSKSLTLGDSNGATSNSAATGAYDLFLANTSDGRSSNIDRIVMKFSTPLSGVLSFDFEIFPDGTCPSLSSCGTSQSNLPDLEFKAQNGVTTLASHTFWADAPCATVGGCQSSANSGKNGNSIHSPASGSSSTELAPQLIGTYTTGFLSNVTELDFIDWPATIGVDNIKFTSTVPEPRGGAFLLGSLILAAFLSTKLRRAFAKS